MNSSAAPISAQPAIWYASIRRVAARRNPIEGAGFSAWLAYEHMFVLPRTRFKGKRERTSAPTAIIPSPVNVEPPIAPPEEPDPELGRVVRRLREEQGLSLVDLANRSKLDPDALSLIEAGASDPPWPTVEAIARGLGISVQAIADAVVERRGEPTDR